MSLSRRDVTAGAEGGISSHAPTDSKPRSSHQWQLQLIHRSFFQVHSSQLINQSTFHMQIQFSWLLRPSTITVTVAFQRSGGAGPYLGPPMYARELMNESSCNFISFQEGPVGTRAQPRRRAGRGGGVIGKARRCAPKVLWLACLHLFMCTMPGKLGCAIRCGPSIVSESWIFRIEKIFRKFLKEWS